MNPQGNNTMKRTKIICTIGPASESPEVIQALIDAGMDVARLNFSHETYEAFVQRIKLIRQISVELNKTVAILQDLSGPKLRIGRIANQPALLTPGNLFTLTTRPVAGDEREVSTTYRNLPKEVKSGDTIFLADGQFELKVLNVNNTDINCEVVVGGELTSNKGINVPGVSLSTPAVTEKDIDDLKFGIRHNVDWIAISFVRNREDILRARRVLKESQADIPIIAKIEKREALYNINEIIQVVDGLMVARGDLGLEIPIREITTVQKQIIKKANAVGIPVITATQMLESMIENPRPTRAEVTDIANAIFDGTDAVMLSGETAIGKYPVQAARVMDEVAGGAEDNIDYVKLFQQKQITPDYHDIPDAISHATCHVALNIGAKAIICCTRSGQTARMVAKYRPHAPIIVVSASEEVLRRLVLLWGVFPLKIEQAMDTDDMITKAKRAALESGIANRGDTIVIVAGIPIDIPGTTNTIKADVL
ncbi:pyruvate kinase [Candidatus Poribacteria bacterium]|nr:pyruvate kinase [Candidatus Poribacteria bacterium]